MLIIKIVILIKLCSQMFNTFVFQTHFRHLATAGDTWLKIRIRTDGSVPLILMNQLAPFQKS